MMSEAATIVSPDAHENRMTETAAAALHQLPEQHYSISSSCREEAREQLCVAREVYRPMQEPRSDCVFAYLTHTQQQQLEARVDTLSPAHALARLVYRTQLCH